MLPAVETSPCPSCGAPLKRTATFCLACDTPVVDTERGLSVAEPVPVPPARGAPVVAVAIVAGLLVLLGGTAYGTVHLLRGRHGRAEAQAAADVRRGVTLLVRAESGEPGACRSVSALLAGSGRRQECLGIVGKDPGAHLEDVRLDPARLEGETGTVRLHATLVDGRSSRTLDQVYAVVDQSRQWRLQWDGKPM
jgi:hypothetical protein